MAYTLMRPGYDFYKPAELKVREYECGHCSRYVSSDRGYFVTSEGNSSQAGDFGCYICPNCRCVTTFYMDATRHPSSALGRSVQHLPQEVQALYEESRRCTSNGCYTAATLLCRKLLMHIAVDRGDKPGRTFMEYIDYLSNAGYVPPNGKQWVDHIRKKGNEANHEIVIMLEQDAKDILVFTEMLLKFIYEFPAMVTP